MNMTEPDDGFNYKLSKQYDIQEIYVRNHWVIQNFLNSIEKSLSYRDIVKL